MNQPLFTKIVQIGVIVNNVDETIKHYQEVLDLHDWHINYVDTRKGLGSGFRNRNREAEVKVKIGWINIGSVEIELIEPQDDESVYAEFLKEKGPGLHHVLFATENYDKCKQKFSENHLPPLTEGKLQQVEFVTYDSLGKLGMLIEIAKGEPLVPDESLTEHKRS